MKKIILIIIAISLVGFAIYRATHTHSAPVDLSIEGCCDTLHSRIPDTIKDSSKVILTIDVVKANSFKQATP